MAYEVNYCQTKEQFKHLAEVVTSRQGGDPSGAEIDTSTLEYAGQTRNTLDKIISDSYNKIAQLSPITPAIPYGSGQLVNPEDADIPAGKYPSNQVVAYTDPIYGYTIPYLLLYEDDLPYDLSQPFDDSKFFPIHLQRLAKRYEPDSFTDGQKSFTIIDKASGDPVNFIDIEVFINGDALLGPYSDSVDSDYTTSTPQVTLTNYNLKQGDKIWFKYYVEEPISGDAINSESGVVNFYQFGAKGDGSPGDLQPIIDCFNFARANNLTVEQNNGVFNLQGSSNVDVYVSHDVSGATFIVDDFQGGIYIRGEYNWVEHPAGSDVVNNINANAIPAGGSIFDYYADGVDKTLDNKYMMIDTDEDFYIFNGVVKKREIFNVCYNRGVCDDVFKYPVNQNVTRVRTLQIANKWLTAKGWTFQEREVTDSKIIRIQGASMVLLMNTSFVNEDGTEREESFSRIVYDESVHVWITNVNASSVNKTPANKFTYTISGSQSYNVVIENVTADGFGWGATGQNRCAKVEFRNCSLNRIDFHEPVQSYLKVLNCDIGNWGILATIIGDCDVVNTNFYQREGDTNDGIFRSRYDAGGWCDGNLNMINCKVIGEDGDSRPIATCQASTAGGIPPGSPIVDQFFENITITNLIRENTGDTTSIVAFGGDRINEIMVPNVFVNGLKSVEYQNQAYSNIYPVSNMDAFLPRRPVSSGETPLSRRYTSRISIIDCMMDTFGMVSKANDHSPYVTVIAGQSDGKGYDGDNTGTFMHLAQRGFYEFTSCDVRGISFERNGFMPTGQYAYVKLNGGKFGPRNSSDPMLTWDNKSIVEAVGTQVTWWSQNQLDIIGKHIKFDACRIVKHTGTTSFVYTPCYSLWDGEEFNLTENIYVRVGDTIRVETGFTSNNTKIYQEFTFTGADNWAINGANNHTAGLGRLTTTLVDAETSQYQFAFVGNGTDKIRAIEKVF